MTNPTVKCPQCGSDMDLLPARENGPYTFSHICNVCGPSGKRVMAGKLYLAGKGKDSYWVFYFPMALPTI